MTSKRDRSSDSETSDTASNKRQKDDPSRLAESHNDKFEIRGDLNEVRIGLSQRLLESPRFPDDDDCVLCRDKSPRLATLKLKKCGHQYHVRCLVLLRHFEFRHGHRTSDYFACQQNTTSQGETYRCVQGSEGEIGWDELMKQLTDHADTSTRPPTVPPGPLNNETQSISRMVSSDPTENVHKIAEEIRPIIANAHQPMPTGVFKYDKAISNVVRDDTVQAAEKLQQTSHSQYFEESPSSAAEVAQYDGNSSNGTIKEEDVHPGANDASARIGSVPSLTQPLPSSSAADPPTADLPRPNTDGPNLPELFVNLSHERKYKLEQWQSEYKLDLAYIVDLFKSAPKKDKDNTVAKQIESAVGLFEETLWNGKAFSASSRLGLLGRLRRSVEPNVTEADVDQAMRRVHLSFGSGSGFAANTEKELFKKASEAIADSRADASRDELTKVINTIHQIDIAGIVNELIELDHSGTDKTPMIYCKLAILDQGLGGMGDIDDLMTQFGEWKAIGDDWCEMAMIASSPGQKIEPRALAVVLRDYDLPVYDKMRPYGSMKASRIITAQCLSTSPGAAMLRHLASILSQREDSFRTPINQAKFYGDSGLHLDASFCVTVRDCDLFGGASWTAWCSKMVGCA